MISPFVNGLYILGAAAARTRLQQARQTVRARLDELIDADERQALQQVSDSADRVLLDASRRAIELLAAGLAASQGGEPARPRQLPATKPRT